MDTAQTSDPVNRIRRAPAAMLRFAALVLAILSLIFPAVAMSAFDTVVSVTILQLAGWLIIFPAVLVLALISPGVTPLSPYTMLLDIGAAVVGVIASIVLLVSMNTPFGPLGSETGAGLGVGAYALFLATILSILAIVSGGAIKRYLKR